jgi:hypothetical protein
MRLAPNMRVRRTRSSPSALRSPLTRHPLGGTIAAVRPRDRSPARSSIVAVGLLIWCASHLAAQTETPAVATPTVTPAAQPTPRIVKDSSSQPCGQVTAPVLVNRVEPEYTEDARKAGLAGRVVLEAIIAKDGSVEDVRVMQQCNL